MGHFSCRTLDLGLSGENFEINTFTGLRDCRMRQWHGNLKEIMYVYLIQTKAVHTVNHLDMVETGHVLTPSTCSRSPASLFPGLRKAGWGPGNEATHLSGRTVKYGMLLKPECSYAPTWAWWGWSVTLWSSFADSIRGRGRLGTRVDFQLESIKTLWSSILTTSFNIIV